MSVSMMSEIDGTKAVKPDFSKLRAQIDERLAALVPAGTGPAEAARHSLLAPGKRLRAILTIISALECGKDADSVLDVACAMEMIHTASLVFDDLPAMDDAELRRGMKTPHVLFGDDVAILAGIGLLNGAFGAIAKSTLLSDAQKTDVMAVISNAVGWSGLVGGQALDLCSHENDASLEAIHDGKTGVLFEAAALGGAIVAGQFSEMERPLKDYAYSLGRAYQAFDDILDSVADDQLAGKSTARDNGKRTALSASEGMDEALGQAAGHLERAKAALPTSQSAESPLRYFADCVHEHFEKTFAAASNQQS